MSELNHGFLRPLLRDLVSDVLRTQTTSDGPLFSGRQDLNICPTALLIQVETDAVTAWEHTKRLLLELRRSSQSLVSLDVNQVKIYSCSHLLYLATGYL